MFPALECLDVEGSETPGRPEPGLVAVPPNPDSADQVKVSLFSPFPCFGATLGQKGREEEEERGVQVDEEVERHAECKLLVQRKAMGRLGRCCIT